MQGRCDYEGRGHSKEKNESMLEKKNAVCFTLKIRTQSLNVLQRQARPV